MNTILVAGATGLIGNSVVRQLLERPSFRVISLVRRPHARDHERLVQWQAANDDLLSALRDENVDAVICCLGTTIKTAGSQEKFRYVDHDLVVGIGKWAKTHGVRNFCVVSAIGADAGSKIFYNKVKGEMEKDLEALGLPSLYIFQPSILTGPRKESRIGERIGIVITKMISPLLLGGLRVYRPMPHDLLAKALVNAAKHHTPGVHRYTYDQIMELAR